MCFAVLLKSLLYFCTHNIFVGLWLVSSTFGHVGLTIWAVHSDSSLSTVLGGSTDNYFVVGTLGHYSPTWNMHMHTHTYIHTKYDMYEQWLIKPMNRTPHYYVVLSIKSFDIGLGLPKSRFVRFRAGSSMEKLNFHISCLFKIQNLSLFSTFSPNSSIKFCPPSIKLCTICMTNSSTSVVNIVIIQT